MKDEQVDQFNAYSEYYKAVQNFNRANDEYFPTINQITNNRRLAIEKAIEIQIKPVLSKVRGVQSASIGVSFLCLIFFIIGWKQVPVSSSININQLSDMLSAFVKGGVGVLIILGSLGIGVIAVIVTIWSSAKINSLTFDMEDAQESANTPPDVSLMF